MADDLRIRSALPTIELLRERGARVVLCSHLGRPRGRDPETSLQPVAERLAELRGRQVGLATEVVGEQVSATGRRARARRGAVAREHALGAGRDEERPRARGAPRRAWRGLRQRRVRRRPSRARLDRGRGAPPALGRRAAARARGHDARGGDRGSRAPARRGPRRRQGERQDRIDRPLPRARGRAADRRRDVLQLLSRAGAPTGESLVEEEGVELARERARRAAERGDACRLLLPDDLVLGDRFDADAERRELDGIDVPDGWMGLDIGPRTARLPTPARSQPPGPCSGTGRWGRSSSSRSPAAPALSPRRWRPRPGRPSSAAATRPPRWRQFGLADRVTHLSTGGGAALELLEGKALPGVEALDDA